MNYTSSLHLSSDLILRPLSVNQSRFQQPDGIWNTDVTIRRAVLHCLPVLGHLLYMIEAHDTRSHLKSMATTSHFGFVYGANALRANNLMKKDKLLSTLFLVQTLVSLATIIALVALNILILPVRFGVGCWGAVKFVSFVNATVFFVPKGLFSRRRL